ncbi:hypothetical protein ACMFMG_005452 [Clarireedia jacksonii]
MVVMALKYFIFLAISAIAPSLSSATATSLSSNKPSTGPTAVIYETVTLASGVVATGNNSVLILKSTTIRPGSAEHTIDGHTISFGPSGTLDIDGKTTKLNPSGISTLSSAASSSPRSIIGTGISAPSSGLSRSSSSISGFPSTASMNSSKTSSSSHKPSSGSSSSLLTSFSATRTGSVTSSISTSHSSFTTGKSSGSHLPITSSGITNPSSTFSLTSSSTSDPITSTLTVPPASFSTQGVTISGLTINTWITTTKDGQSTVVPVLVGCPACGGVFGGIILWGLPALTNVLFKFPTFPGIPPFYLPCIRSFGISIGSCTQGPTPTPDGDGSTDPTSDPGNTQTKSSDSKTSTSTSKSSSSSSSSCTITRTVTDILVKCSTASTSGSLITSCFSTSTQIISGCSVTASTTSTFVGGACLIPTSAPVIGKIGTYSFNGYAPFNLPDITGTRSGVSSSSTGPTSKLQSGSQTSKSTSISSSSSRSSSPSRSSSSTKFSSSPTTLSTTTRKPSSSNSSSTFKPISASSSTTLPPRVAAPEITITTPSATPNCVQGFQTYTMPAVASAPANAASLKFAIPEADTVFSNWQFQLLPGFFVDPGTNVANYQVGTNAVEPPITSGEGGTNLTIKWQAPKGANGTYVELLFKDDPPLGVQTYGVVAYGSGIACMPDVCSGPPTVTTSDDGTVCKLYPCSTDPSCEPGGPVTPRAACEVIEDGEIVPLWYDVNIVTNNYITDDGAALKKQESGCGDLLSWSVSQINIPSGDGSWVASQSFSFTLPLTIAAGCVERAIASAGGPSGLQCVNSVSDWVF